MREKAIDDMIDIHENINFHDLPKIRWMLYGKSFFERIKLN